MKLSVQFPELKPTQLKMLERYIKAEVYQGRILEVQWWRRQFISRGFKGITGYTFNQRAKKLQAELNKLELL